MPTEQRRRQRRSLRAGRSAAVAVAISAPTRGSRRGLDDSVSRKTSETSTASTSVSPCTTG